MCVRPAGGHAKSEEVAVTVAFESAVFVFLHSALRFHTEKDAARRLQAAIIQMMHRYLHPYVRGGVLYVCVIECGRKWRVRGHGGGGKAGKRLCEGRYL